MKYKIIEVNEYDHSIVVRYYSKEVTEQDLAVQFDASGNVLRCRTDYSIDLPIPCPRGQGLHDLIMANAPSAWFDRKGKVADPTVNTSMAFLAPQVGVEVGAGRVAQSGDTSQLEIARVAKLNEIADWRFAREKYGFIYGGYNISVTKEGVSGLLAAKLALADKTVDSVAWKTNLQANTQPVFLTLDSASVALIWSAAIGYSQSLFLTEKQLTDAALAATTKRQVGAVTVPPQNSDFPVSP